MAAVAAAVPACDSVHPVEARRCAFGLRYFSCKLEMPHLLLLRQQMVVDTSSVVLPA